MHPPQTHKRRTRVEGDTKPLTSLTSLIYPCVREQLIHRAQLVSSLQFPLCIDRHPCAADPPQAIFRAVVPNGDVANGLHPMRDLATVLAILEPRREVVLVPVLLAPSAPLSLSGDQLRQ